MRVLISCFLTVCMLTGMCAFAESDVCVRVGDRTFTNAEVQTYADQAMFSMQMMAGTDAASLLDEEERAMFLSEAAQHFVTIAVLDERLKADGLYEISEEEDEALHEFARDTYDTLWQQLNEQLKREFTDMDAADIERVVSELMDSAGYSMDALYDTGLLELREERLIEKYCADVTVSDEEVLAYYDENYVAPHRERYENNIDQFDADIYVGGAKALYVPDGYFYIKYISFEPEEQAGFDIRDREKELSEAEAAMQEAYDTLAMAAVEDAATDEMRDAYKTAEDAVTAAQEALDAAIAAAEEDYLPIYALAKAAMADGVSFEELIEDYSTDKSFKDSEGLPFHPESKMWEDRLSEKVTALENEGDITEPVYAGSTIYIVCRMADIPAGAQIPGATELEDMKETMRYAMQKDRLETLCEEWLGDKKVEINTDGLTYPMF